MSDPDRLLLFPEYFSSAPFVTVFETHAENGEVPADFTRRGPTWKGNSPPGVSSGVPQGSGETEIAGYEENDKKCPHDDKP
jgi:hypothetical protein